MNVRLTRQPRSVADAVEWYWRYIVCDEQAPTRSDIETHLDCAMDALTERQRQVLIERADEHKTLTQIAGEMALSKERVRQVYNRALQVLRAQLSQIINENERTPGEAPIELLNLNASDYRLLKRRGIETVAQLAQMSGVELMKVRSIGFTKAERIMAAYQDYAEEHHLLPNGKSS